MDSKINLNDNFLNIANNIQDRIQINKVNQSSNFGDFLQKALDKVNELQSTANTMQVSFEQGNTNINLSDVMIASNKAKIALNATIAIRNKLVEAYNSVYNMNI